MSVLVFAGPSGGHLFPAAAFGEVLRERHPRLRIHLVTGKRGEGIASKIAPGIFDEILYLRDFPLSQGISLNTFRFLLEFPMAFMLSSRYLSKIKPKLCLGFGSYTSYPGLLLASWRGIPTLIHEQNLIPGIATRRLAAHVDCVAVSFQKTVFDRNLKRRETVGIPLRRSLRVAAGKGTLIAARETSKITVSGGEGERMDRKPMTILIVGGSQGAHRLNEVVLESFSRLSSEEKMKIAVIHITGQRDWKLVTQSYRNLGLTFEAHPFFEKMDELYSRADMAITRAGANTLFELALFKIPAIVVPYPYAGSHQKPNAEFFASQNAVICQEETRFTNDWLLEELRTLMNSAGRRRNLSDAIAGLAAPDAAEKLADLAEGLMV